LAGNGTFKISVWKLPLLALSDSIAVGDFNTDGNQDLVIAAFGGTSILLGNGKGIFQTLIGSNSREGLNFFQNRMPGC
jgi:hypothetical protein